ncbi:ketoreductase domain-containing protein [Paenibacillus rhizoplanae]
MRDSASFYCLKIQGTRILDKLTEQDNLDFLMLFSSVSSVFGGPGQSDYTAANAFMDAYAELRNRSGKKNHCYRVGFLE